MALVDRNKEFQLVRDYVNNAKREFDALALYTRRFDLYPFDMMGLGILSKAFSLANAVFVLLDAEMEDQAYALCRSIVECSLNLRYLTQDPGQLWTRTDGYMRFAVADKQYWMHWALQSAVGTPMEAKILEYGKKWGLTPDTKGASKHWSGEKGFAWVTNLKDHPLDGDKSTEFRKKSQYAVDYYQTSSYIHCYSTALDNFWPTECTQFSIEEHSRQPQFQKTLYIVLEYIHSSIAYTIFGLGMNRPQVFNELHSQTLQAMAPYEQRFI